MSDMKLMLVPEMVLTTKKKRMSLVLSLCTNLRRMGNPGRTARIAEPMHVLHVTMSQEEDALWFRGSLSFSARWGRRRGVTDNGRTIGYV